MRRSSRVADYMTPSAHFIASEVSLSVARERMRRLGIRSLPVVQDGKLCGVLSERDVALAESLANLELAELTVGAAMGRDLYPVAASAPLSHVVGTMAAHGYSSAVVMAEGAVVGVFAASDALRVLSIMLEVQRDDQNGMSASEVRAVILTEHAHVHALLLRTHRMAHRLRSRREPPSNAGRVREYATHMRHAIESYLALEDRELSPVLSDLTGSSKTLGQNLTNEYVQLVADTAAFTAILEDRELPAGELAEQLDYPLSNLKRDLEREHALLLALEAASNDSIITDAAVD